MFHKYKIFFLSTFLLLLSSCAVYRQCVPESELSSITIVDQNGFSETISSSERIKRYENVNFLTPMPFQKVVRVKKRDSRGDIHTILTTYHPNGQPKQYLEILNGRAYGAYKEFHPNGTQKLEVCVLGGEPDIFPDAQKTWIFHGTSRAWHDDGTIQAEVPYENGTMNGTSFYYHQNGQIWKRVPHQKGKIEGTVQYHLASGELLQTAEYHDDKRNGAMIRLWNNQKQAAVEEWQQGLLVSGLYYCLDGKLFCSVNDGHGSRAVFAKDYISEMHEFRNGKEEGEVRILNPAGELLRHYYIKGGLKNGEDVVYYPDQPGRQAKISAFWVDGVLHGTVKTWYPTGILESQRQMNNHHKQGVFSAWYTDGSLMLIEEYEQNKLVKGKYFKKGSKSPISEVKKGEGTASLFDANGNFIEKVTYRRGRPFQP